MIPILALVGRPNVGKSTLFNRLTRTQNALVADVPGLTRDRQYGEASFENKPFIVIDTGGLGIQENNVDDLMAQQSRQAIDEATYILFLVDGRAGLTAADLSIAEMLRKTNKQIILVVNKAEGLTKELICAEFQSLGFKSIYSISASHGQGVGSLLSSLAQDFLPVEETLSQNDTIKIAFVGRPNVGKSTLINRILGEERVVVYNAPGTTRDSIAVPFTRDERKYTLIDTAGVRRRARVDEKIEKFSVIKTLQSIKDAHVCLMLLDAQEGLTEQDMHLLGFIIEAGKALVVLVNKWDGLDKEHKEHIQRTLERRLHFTRFAKMRFISALHGTGVGLIFKDIEDAYASAILPLSTSRLTRLLEDIVAQHPPPMVKGRRIKLRYAHAGGHNPPTIIIHGNQLDALPGSYEKYLSKQFSSHLDLVGTPLKIEFRIGANPFKGKKNTLTDRQVKKRKRLIKKIKKSK